MRLENLMRGKVFVFAQEDGVSDAEQKILSDIMADSDLGEVTNISLIDQNDNNDAFRVSTELGTFCVKITLDEEDETLTNEASILAQMMSHNIPYLISMGTIQSLGGKYIVTSYVPKQNVGEYGMSSVISSKESFAKILAQLNREKISAPSFLSFLRRKYLEFTPSSLPGFQQLDFSNEEELLNIATTEINFLKEQIQATYDKSFEGETFCHGNLSASRILTRSGDFSFINLEDSYIGNPLLDLAGLKYELFIQGDMEEALLSEYRKYLSFTDQDYKKCAQFMKTLKFYDLLVAYIKEVFIFKGLRQKKLLELTTKMSKNFGLFSGLPSFERHRDKIAKIFSASAV